MFSEEIRREIGAIAVTLGVEPAALLGVSEVESNGQAFDEVDGRKMPLIRWEGHYFHRLLPEHLRERAVRARLAHPNAGRIPNPADQQARYDLLARAKTIHREAALSSCSWGLGQVMGSHWRTLDFPSVERLVETACSGVAGQVELMARFIRVNRLTEFLERKDWPAFARAYNGPGYRLNGYDTRMAEAYARYCGDPNAAAKSPVLLRFGSEGPAVTLLQERLREAGYQLRLDGDFGSVTRRALKEFQRVHGLDADGVAGPLTLAALERVPRRPDANGGASPRQRLT